MTCYLNAHVNGRMPNAIASLAIHINKRTIFSHCFMIGKTKVDACASIKLPLQVATCV